MQDAKMNELLQLLCQVHSPSGDELHMKNFLLHYIHEHSRTWKVKPKIVCGREFQDCAILIFGNPSVAAFAHMDTTGFTVRYQNQLIPIGGPEVNGGETLTGIDQLGEIECTLDINVEGQLHYQFGRGISSGTNLVFKSTFEEDRSCYCAPYLDNRAGIYNLLRLAENLQNGALVFSCWEEHGGGSVPFLVKFLYDNFQINKILISDITWATDGIHLDEGVVISFRDRNIPRKSFIDKIVKQAIGRNIPFQVEVESHGSSDGREIQQSPYPIDWCFVGPAVENAHSNHEKISKTDLDTMTDFYKVLFNHL